MRQLTLPSRPQVGVAYRGEFEGYLEFFPDCVTALEFTAEHFFHGRRRKELKRWSKRYASALHCLGFSLGSEEPISSWRLEEVRSIAKVCDPLWISDHFAFTRANGVDLGHLNPVAFDRDTLDRFVEKAKFLQRECARPFAFENISRWVNPPGDWHEADFMNEFCRRSGAGLLLDITNLFVNSRNLGFDPLEWLGRLDLSHVRQLHLVGYTKSDGLFWDAHREAIQPELLELGDWVLARCRPEMIIIERDENLGSLDTLIEDLGEVARRAELSL